MSAQPQPETAVPTVSVATLYATGTIEVVAALILNALPAIVGALTEIGRLDAAQVGYIVGVDLAAQVFGTVLFMGQARRLRWSTSLSAGLVLMVIGNILSCFAPSTAALFATRIIAGTGTGIVRSACLLAFGRARDPARAMGLLGAAQVVGMSAAFAVFPWLTRTVGWFGPYLMLSVLGVLMFATVPWWPTKLQSERTPPVSLSFGRAGTVCLIAIFLYYVAQAAVWAFLEALGTTVGQPTDRIASALALVGIPGVAASLLVSVVSKRLSLRQGLLIGFGLTLGSLYLLTVHAGMWTFGLGVGLFYFAWCGTVPFQFASAAASDLSGNAVAAFPAADGLGLAAGPAIAGAMVMQLGTHSVVALAVACTALGIGLFYWISPSSAQVHRIAKQV